MGEVMASFLDAEPVDETPAPDPTIIDVMDVVAAAHEAECEECLRKRRRAQITGVVIGAALGSLIVGATWYALRSSRVSS